MLDFWEEFGLSSTRNHPGNQPTQPSITELTLVDSNSSETHTPKKVLISIENAKCITASHVADLNCPSISCCTLVELGSPDKMIAQSHFEVLLSLQNAIKGSNNTSWTQIKFEKYRPT
jgi:hypothetical protein